MYELQTCAQCNRGIPWTEATCIHCGMTLAVNVRMEKAPADPKVRYELIKRLSALNLPLKVELPAQLKRESPELANNVTRAVAAEVGRTLSSMNLEFEVVPRSSSARGAKGIPVSWAIGSLTGLVLSLIGGLVFALRRDPAPTPASKEPILQAPITPAVAPAQTASLKEQIRSVVIVKCPGEGLGTGFFVAPRRVVTNHHVLCQRGAPNVVLSSGGEIPASVVGSDPKHDLALLAVPIDGPPLPVADASAAEIGTNVTMIGTPRGLEFTVTRAMLSYVGRALFGMSVLQLDGSVNPGNSGGPLIDASGHVIGVVSARLMNADGIGLAVPINYLVAGEKPLWAEGPRDLLSPEWNAWEERAKRTELAAAASPPPPVEGAPQTRIKSMIVDAQWLSPPEANVWRRVTPVLRAAVITDDPLDTDRRWAFDLKFGDQVMCQVFRTKTESWMRLSGRVPYTVPNELHTLLEATPGPHYVGIMQLQWSNCPDAYSHRAMALELPEAPKPFHSITVSY